MPADISGFLEQHGVRLRCIGQLGLLQPEMQEALREMERATAKNTKWVGKGQLTAGVC